MYTYLILRAFELVTSIVVRLALESVCLFVLSQQDVDAARGLPCTLASIEHWKTDLSRAKNSKLATAILYMAEVQAAIDDASRHLKGTGKLLPLIAANAIL